MPIKETFDQITRVLRLFSKQEVKTPLSFLFKVVFYLTIFWIFVLYSPIEESLKFTIILFSAAIFLFLSGLVLLFAWFRPRHLVYGETGHRAERKMIFGTDKKHVTELDLETVPSVQDDKQKLIE